MARKWDKMVVVHRSAIASEVNLASRGIASIPVNAAAVLCIGMSLWPDCLHAAQKKGLICSRIGGSLPIWPLSMWNGSHKSHPPTRLFSVERMKDTG